MNIRHTFILLLCIFTLFSCTEKSSKTETKSDYVKAEKNLVGLFNGKIFCIPSPYKFAQHILNLQLPYNPTILNSTAHKFLYESTFKKCINLGIYGIDLAYINTHEQSTDALQYFSAIKSISDEVGISDVFDIQTIERVENNIESKDSMLFILSNKYREIDLLLKTENQKNLAALILTGSWLESLYLLTELEKERPHSQTREHISEHMFSANSILGLLKPFYNTGEEYKLLTDKIVDICYWFDGVSYDYTYSKPITYPEIKRTVFTSKSSIKIYPEHLENITKQVNELRNSLIK
ncbi:MAG: hypothetical protein GX277_01595 [Bacteroidales bacterium]|jgi:hypothetical protein|nr:hypothetical protein [Bacteroidales bacterium]